MEAYSSQVEHLARPMVEHMLRLWREIITDRSEEDGSLEDESALAASGLLQAVQTVVNELFKANKLDVLFALNDLLMPLLDMLFNKEGPTLEFLEEAFSLFGDLIVAYEGHVATLPAMWHIYAKMMHTIQDAAMDYMPSATVRAPPLSAARAHVCRRAGIRACGHTARHRCMRALIPPPAVQYPVDALYSYAPDRFAAPADPDTGIDNAALLCSTAAFVESHASESERGLMTRLIISMLHNCRGRVDRLIPGIIALYGKSSQDAHTVRARTRARAHQPRARCCHRTAPPPLVPPPPLCVAEVVALSVLHRGGVLPHLQRAAHHQRHGGSRLDAAHLCRLVCGPARGLLPALPRLQAQHARLDVHPAPAARLAARLTRAHPAAGLCRHREPPDSVRGAAEEGGDPARAGGRRG
ncbi:hypothetical protein EON68_00935 [archaeon]|nr:MAG: hypothetical protein EON68_00935 [archaeon]